MNPKWILHFLSFSCLVSSIYAISLIFIRNDNNDNHYLFIGICGGLGSIMSFASTRCIFSRNNENLSTKTPVVATTESPAEVQAETPTQKTTEPELPSMPDIPELPNITLPSLPPIPSSKFETLDL